MTKREKIEFICKQTVFIGLLVFLFIPLIQTITHFKKYVRPLDGAFHSEKDIDFTWENWLSNKYSDQKDKYMRENFGFRDYYIRLICQVNFSLFEITNVNTVVIGKENYLYETPYINAFYGRDFIGKNKIDEHVKKLKAVQDTLQKSNKLIIAVFAPGKASFYPEYIPDNYKSKKTESNYEGFIKSMNAYNFNHIDFNKLFNDQKTTSKYPLYPQLGIHWSNYGSVIAFDSITKYIESKLNINLPDLEITKTKFSEELQGTDNDAIKSLNLLRTPKTFKMAYPEWQIHYDYLKHKKIKVLVVGDSFWWQIYATTLHSETYSSSSFWFYNHEMYPESYSKPTFVSQVDYGARIREADAIIILHSEATLKLFGGGFADMCYETFFTPGLRKQKIFETKEKIKKSKEWYNSILEAAKTSTLSVDSTLTLNAIYALEQERK